MKLYCAAQCNTRLAARYTVVAGMRAACPALTRPLHHTAPTNGSLTTSPIRSACRTPSTQNGQLRTAIPGSAGIRRMRSLVSNSSASIDASQACELHNPRHDVVERAPPRAPHTLVLRDAIVQDPVSSPPHAKRVVASLNSSESRIQGSHRRQHPTGTTRV